MSNFFQRSGTGRLYQNPSTVQNSDFDITATNIPVAVRNDPTYGTYRKYADGTTQGRLLTSSVVRSAAVALTTATAATIATLAVPRGKWTLTLRGGFLLNAATSVSRFNIAISKTTNTLPGADMTQVEVDQEVRTQDIFTALTGRTDFNTSIPGVTIEVDTDTTFYYVARSDFTVNSCAAYGSLQAVSIV